MPYYVHKMLNIIVLVVLFFVVVCQDGRGAAVQIKERGEPWTINFPHRNPETTEEKQAKIGELSELEKKIWWVGGMY